MIAQIARRLPSPRAARIVALLSLGLLGPGLAGCAGSVSDLGDNLSLAFVDPARYDFLDCKALQTERKNIANRIVETQRLMDKADTGVAGPVVAELAYRNDYIASRGQAKLADEAWRRNKCVQVPDADLAAATPAPAAMGKGQGKGKDKGGLAVAPRSGSAVY